MTIDYFEVAKSIVRAHQKEKQVCAFCGAKKNIQPGYYAHIGGYGDPQRIPPSCSDIIPCIERQAKKLEEKLMREKVRP